MTINMHGMPIPDTEYNRKRQQETMQKRIQEITQNINKVKKLAKNTKLADPIVIMELIEQIISGCGGEQKLQFLEVTRDFIKIFTRVPLEANLFQFKLEGKDNPRFHKIVTEILMLSEAINGVRWVQAERGSHLLVSMGRVGNSINSSVRRYESHE